MHDVSVEVTVRYINKYGVVGRVYIIKAPEITVVWTALEDTHTDDIVSQVVAMDGAAKRSVNSAATE